MTNVKLHNLYCPMADRCRTQTPASANYPARRRPEHNYFFVGANSPEICTTG